MTDPTDDAVPQSGFDGTRLARVPPPVFHLVPLSAAIVINYTVWTWRFMPLWAGLSIGVPLAALSGGIALWAIRTMDAQGESLDFREVTRSLVVRGPFAFSRNPMYLSLVLFSLGVGMIMRSVPVLLSVPVSALAMQHFVIIREEAYLEARLGEAFRSFRERVRRWI